MIQPSADTWGDHSREAAISRIIRRPHRVINEFVATIDHSDWIHHCDAAHQPNSIALSSEVLPLHPRNGILRVWLELGGIGIAPGFAPLLLVIRHAFRIPAWRTRLVNAMIARTAAAAVSVRPVSFGSGADRRVSGLFVVAAFAVLAARGTTAAAVGSILLSARGRQA